MSLNLSIQLVCAFFVVVWLSFARFPREKRYFLDRWLFWGVSTLLVIFAAFRPLGVGVDDLNYAHGVFDMTCSTFTCGQWIQGKRDQGWYSIVGLLRSFYPHPQVILWLAGLSLAVKLWVMDRLCRHRCLALFFYISCFYIIHDISALRVSLAISVYLLSFYWLVRGRYLLGAGLLMANGFFHQQAFLAPLLLLGRWFRWTPVRLTWVLLLPLFLLSLAVYPNETLLNWLVAQPWGKGVTDVLFGIDTPFLSTKLIGGYDHVRIVPVVVPPTLLLTAWLLPDLTSRASTFAYVSTSLVTAAWLLWGYAIIPDVQLRFWHFFLLPIVFVIGNAKLTRWKLVAILSLSAIYLFKYTVIHDLLLDQRRVQWDAPVGGEIAMQTRAIDCGEGCVTQGSAATLNATASAGYIFVGWFGGCAGSEPTCTVMVDDDVWVGALFDKVVNLSLTIEGQGAVAPEYEQPCWASCNRELPPGSQMKLVATSADGWCFAGWSGGCKGGMASCSLKLEVDQAVTAKFLQCSL